MKLQKFRSIVTVFIFVVAWGAALGAQVPNPREVVVPAAFASNEPAARGKSVAIAVVLKIRPGFHINAREKSEEYLIATDLKAPNVPAGFKVGEIAYPKGELHAFAFTKKQLNVYQDTVVIRLPLTVLPTAALGEQHLPLKLRYQACSTEVCLPPVTLDVDAKLNVVASSSAAKPAHAELFPKP